MALKTDIRITTKEGLYNHGEVEDRSNELFCGSFAHYEARPIDWYALFMLDEFDKDICSEVPMKAGDQIFRFKSKATRVAKMSPLVKINMKTKMAYFLTEEAHQTGEIEFEKKGCKLRYMTLAQEALHGENLAYVEDFLP